MPRLAILDAPGVLHHVMDRGIERRKIFEDDTDRVNFLDRLGKVLSETGTKCFAWALIPNHFQLLLRTGGCPIFTVMRRMLTGHAMNFNRRHRRSGQLFQNRYRMRMGIVPYHLIDITTKTFKLCLKYGLKRAFWG